MSHGVDRVGSVRRSSVSLAEARRIALAAQGFGVPAPTAVGTRQLNGLMQRLGVLQLDSVNVFERSHYLPVFARLGFYDKADLDRVLFSRRSDYTEYWAHVAAVIPISDWPLFRFRMTAMRDRYGRPGSWADSHRDTLEWARQQVAERGTVRASELEHPTGKGAGGWWGWSDVKQALELLWLFGELVTSGRDRFERTYALTSDRLPARILDAVVPVEDAKRTLVSQAVRALGIGTIGDIADYYRMRVDDTKCALLDLAEEGTVAQVSVDGWKQPAFLYTDARIPRRIEASALLSPFDPVVWERDRSLRLFDFHYRIEIYTPEPKRVYGYYSLPILLGDTIVGRIDLKNDRQARVLRVQSAWREPGAPMDVAERVVPLLESVARWQGHDAVEFAGRGDLSPELEGAWRASR
jgi:uncharacterized protein YcaQ